MRGVQSSNATEELARIRFMGICGGGCRAVLSMRDRRQGRKTVCVCVCVCVCACVCVCMHACVRASRIAGRGGCVTWPVQLACG